ncbi:MAG: hypothetical protein FWC32_12940 [Firmicutes bacterium]|nr:hypothetical protein [Bacillota bacterium]
MKEILITFYCPATSRSYDFWVTKTIIVANLIQQVCDAICDYENTQDIFPDRQSLILCSYLGRVALPMTFSLEQAGIKGGDKLALV